MLSISFNCYHLYFVIRKKTLQIGTIYKKLFFNQFCKAKEISGRIKRIYIIVSLTNDMSIHLQKLTLKAKLFRGLGDTTRLSILETLREEEKTTSGIVKKTGQSQSNV